MSLAEVRFSSCQTGFSLRLRLYVTVLGGGVVCRVKISLTIPCTSEVKFSHFMTRRRCNFNRALSEFAHRSGRATPPITCYSDRDERTGTLLLRFPRLPRASLALLKTNLRLALPLPCHEGQPFLAMRQPSRTLPFSKLVASARQSAKDPRTRPRWLQASCDGRCYPGTVRG